MDWSCFTRKIFIQTKVSKVYNAWAQSALISKWFLRKAIYIDTDNTIKEGHMNFQQGDQYEWYWHNWEKPQKGIISKAEENRLIAFDFGGAGLVEILLEETDSGTMLTLVQSGIPIDDESKKNFYFGCSHAWTFWLTNLKAYLEHGITLHETEANIYSIEDAHTVVNN